MSSKVWLLLLLRIFGERVSFPTVNLISSADLNIITKQTEESKRIGEILKGLKLGDANPEGSSDTIHQG
jgi:hypothetical protein